MNAGALLAIGPQDANPIQTIAAAPDTALESSRQDTLETASVDRLLSKSAWHTGNEKSSIQISQEALQLATCVLPVLPVHTGDAGLPSFVGASGLPPRLVDVFVNGIRWLPGVYGVVDATGIPEDLADEMALHGRSYRLATSMQRGSQAISFSSKTVDSRTPMSSLNFVRGPFGGDAIRAGLARHLSPKTRLRFSLDEANSSGQFVNLPYKGQKLAAELVYGLSKRTAWRYYFFDSRNESGAVLPFYPEETNEDSTGFVKEHRIYHAVGFSSPGIFVRPFYWNLRNEFRGSSLRIRHLTERIGVEGGWQKTWRNWQSVWRAEFAHDRITSTSMPSRPTQTYDLRSELRGNVSANSQAALGATFHKEAEWPTAIDVDVEAAFDLTKTLSARALVDRRVINPAPAESAYELEALVPAELQRAAVQVGWQPSDHRSMQVQLAINHFNKPLVSESAATTDTLLLANGRRADIPSLEFLSDWQVSRKVILNAHASLMFQDVSPLYWYHNARRSFARGYVDFLQDFFDGDLAIRLRIAVRHYGKSFGPVYSPAALPPIAEAAGAELLDGQLFVRHGDLLFYFSFENVLNKKFAWRPGVEAPGYFLRWGARIDLTN